MTKRDDQIAAWADAFETATYAVPDELLLPVLRKLIANIEAERARVKRREWLRSYSLKNLAPRRIAFREMSVMVQILVRAICNDNSDLDAARWLFTLHRDGHGSGLLLDYLDGLPGIKIDQKALDKVMSEIETEEMQ